LVGTQVVESKGTCNERVYGKSNPTLKNGHQREKSYIWASTPLEGDISFVTIGDITILKNALGYSKGSQRHSKSKKVRVAHFKLKE